MSLSPREQKALAAIEDGLSTTDPALVAALTRADSPSPILRRAASVCWFSRCSR
ncbi:DUF3040 domain-containing protein [Pseudonocardia bannensis]